LLFLVSTAVPAGSNDVDEGLVFFLAGVQIDETVELYWRARAPSEHQSGGGIFNQGVLTVDSSTVKPNALGDACTQTTQTTLSVQEINILTLSFDGGAVTVNGNDIAPLAACFGASGATRVFFQMSLNLKPLGDRVVTEPIPDESPAEPPVAEVLGSAIVKPDGTTASYFLHKDLLGSAVVR
jgi:hypothetical protein